MPLARTLVAVALGMIAAAPAFPSPGTDPPKSPCDRESGKPTFSAAGITEEQANSFLAALKKAVAADDRPKVASLANYPLRAWAKDRSLTLKAPEAFLARYDTIITPRLKQTIAEARVECVFANEQGAMIHDGEVWFRASETGDLKIITINRPIVE